MNLEEAWDMADSILEQERIEPTTAYVRPVSYASFVPALGGPQARSVKQRNAHYYPVQERTSENRFVSSNYDLLCILLGRLSDQDRLEFLNRATARIKGGEAFARRNINILREGFSDASTSEAPLLAEFLVRQGYVKGLIEAMNAAPLTPALTLLLFHIRNMIAWNFTVFTSSDLNSISAAATMQSKRATSHRPSTQDDRKDIVSRNTLHNVIAELPDICAAVCEECREAKFLYIKGALSRDMNLEVNQDKLKVSGTLSRLGFTQDLIDSLNEAENLYLTASTGFDFKSSLGHLRSFLENLHVQACSKVHAICGGELPTKWGQTVEYLPANGIITVQEKQFIIPFYTLLSDTGVHPLQASSEHARLLRNISIEYGLLLLNRLEKWTSLN